MFSSTEVQSIQSDSALPLYHQIFQLLKHKIERGDLRHGERLPSELELCSQFGIARVTAKRALDELSDINMVQRQRGRGTVVSYRYEPKLLRAPLTSMLDSLHVMGRETAVKVIEFQRVPASREIAEKLQIEEGAPVDRAMRVRSNDQEPFAYYISHTLPMGDLINAKSLKQHSRLELFQQLGIRLTEVDQVISACAADAQAAKVLELPPGSPLLQLTRVYFDTAHRPVDHLLGFYRPDRFQYHMRLAAQERKR